MSERRGTCHSLRLQHNCSLLAKTQFSDGIDVRILLGAVLASQAVARPDCIDVAGGIDPVEVDVG
jgi:hypothetical protein